MQYFWDHLGNWKITFRVSIYFFICKMRNQRCFFLKNRYIKKQELLNGETGKVAFDDSGDRINAEYHVMNIHLGEKVEKVGQYFYSSVSVEHE